MIAQDLVRTVWVVHFGHHCRHLVGDGVLREPLEVGGNELSHRSTLAVAPIHPAVAR
jgi:hypothetical protein